MAYSANHCRRHGNVRQWPGARERPAITAARIYEYFGLKDAYCDLLHGTLLNLGYSNFFHMIRGET